MKMMVVISTAIFIMSILSAGGITIRPPALWRNDAYFKGYYGGSEVVIIAQTGDLNNASVGTPFIYICAFFCSQYDYQLEGCNSFNFGIIKVASNQLDDARVVWCANEDNDPVIVGKNASLAFSKDGNLLLKDSNGTLVWSTNTPKSMSAVEMRLTFPGRLQLFDSHNVSVWDSFDHPADLWRLSQPLNIGQQLSSSNPHTDLSAAGGIIIRPPVVWTNDANFKGNNSGSEVVIIAQTGDLNNASVGTPFIYICGFFCSPYEDQRAGCDYFNFGIIKVPSNQVDEARVVWCANKDNPVGKNATLDFSKDGNLLLKDSNGTLVWSTNTPKSMSVVEMRLTLQGRLQLFDSLNASVWDSFDHPADRWRLSQPLNIGQQLSSSNPYRDLSAAGGISIRPPVIWTTGAYLNGYYRGGIQVNIIAQIGDVYTASVTTPFIFVCGFFYMDLGSFFFGIVMLPSYQVKESTYPDPAQVVWCANRDHPVGENATLAFSKDGNLLLSDSDGTLVWSTNTPKSKSAVEIRLTFPGRLQLFDFRNVSVWDSFDYPTDKWLLGQRLNIGQQLSSNNSDTGLSTGQFFLRVVPTGLKAYLNSNPPLAYYALMEDEGSDSILFKDGVLELGFVYIPLIKATSLQFLRLELDGHLRHYTWNSTTWDTLEDVLIFSSNLKCSNPMVCGEYGLCIDGQCTCVDEMYFRRNAERISNQGCHPITPISCESSALHHLIPLVNISYLNYADLDAAVVGITNLEQCKQTCLKNCSCRAALFRTTYLDSKGYCYLPSQLYTLMSYDPAIPMYNSDAYIKVQRETLENPEKAHKKIGALLGSVLASILVGSLLIGFVVLRVKGKFSKEMESDDDLEEMCGLPTRFTFEELKTITDNFSKKLGQGGFGSVFEGIMDDNTVAVKRLDNVGQGMKEFLAEVTTIGNIQHIHLVRLIGFCSEKTCRMLVYEYMSNGSLDKWIYYKNNVVLEWKTRVRIITEVAKALAYLHEECRRRIIHLDIKPQNILLDEGFHAKVSDFGLAKLIDREQSHVQTTMRGTRGYLAPEWLTSKITEKADVYSFGVVVLEVVCGRPNLDYKQEEECVHLISLLQDKVKECRMTDILDNNNNDTHLYKEEMVKMIKLAIWCLQHEYIKRPSMSMVMKVLDGSSELQTNVDINFTVTTPSVNVRNLDDSYIPSATHLSGGR